LFIVFFSTADGFKSTYDGAIIELAKKKVQNDPDLLAYWTSVRDAADANYAVYAFMNYVSSILAIAVLGVGLALADHFKAKEEKAAEDGLEVLVRPGSSKKPKPNK